MASSGEDCARDLVSRMGEMHKKHPDLVLTILEDSLEAEPVLDYITDLEIRRGMFLDVQSYLDMNEYTSMLKAVALGIIMVAPISRLKEQLDKIQADPDSAESYGILGFLNEQAISGIKAFVIQGGARAPQKRSASGNSSIGERPTKRRRSSQMDLPSSGQVPPLSAATSYARRLEEAIQHCKYRDNWECLLTGMPDPEAAHIFPNSTIQTENFTHIKRMLDSFWGKEKADIWSKSFRDKNVSVSAQNLLCLNRQLHWWFGNARMALKPIRKTEDNSVVVQFHWLKQGAYKSSTRLNKSGSTRSNRSGRTTPFDEIMSTAGLSSNQAWGRNLAHRRSGLPIETGQTFVLRAKGSIPAPSFELLELSWDLLRVAAICGAAEPEDMSDEDNDEGDNDEDDYD